MQPNTETRAGASKTFSINHSDKRDVMTGLCMCPMTRGAGLAEGRAPRSLLYKFGLVSSYFT